MTDAHRFGVVPLIADTCVWSKLHRAPADLRDDFVAAGDGGLILSSVVVRMEWLHDARNRDEFDEREAIFSQLRELPITEAVCDAALGALRELRAIGADGYWRVGLPDALIAATAACAPANVLTDNMSDFKKLAEVLDFEPVQFPVEANSTSHEGGQPAG